MKEQEETIFSKDAGTRRLQNAFGEALGDLPTDADVQEAWKRFVRRRTAKKRKRVIGLYASGAVAAAVMILFIFGFPWRGSSGTEFDFAVFTALQAPRQVLITESGDWIQVATPPATTKPVTLPDGTCVLLGANSRLEYPKLFPEQGVREVRLSGEARFEVSKDVARPFLVFTGKMQTEVLGTVFDVNAYPGSGTSAVTLYQGRVRVSDDAERRDILPGQQVVLTEKKGLSLRKAAVSATESWVNGEFVFDDAPLAEVLQAVGTWYNVSVVFRAADLLHLRIHFRYTRQASLSELIQVLNDLGIAHLEQDKERVLVKSRFTKD